MSVADLHKPDEQKPGEAATPPDDKKPEQPHDDPQHAHGKRRRVLIIAAIVLTLAMIGGVLWWLDARNYETTDDAFIDVHMVRVAPQVPGRVLQVLINDNQEIHQGDALMQIDPADFKARLDQALAGQSAAGASLVQAQAQQSSAAANIAEAQAEITVAEANATNAASELNRNKPLEKKSIVSHQQLDNLTAASRSATANLEAAHKKETAAEAQRDVAASQIKAAEADLKSADAQVEQARLNLSYTKITASVDGHVAQKNVADGDYVQVGQNVMALVPAAVWVTANFKETQLDHMQPGQHVELEVDAYPGEKFHGHVESIQSGGGGAFSLLPPENATGNYIKIVQRVPVKIVFDETPDAHFYLGPGMSVVPTVTVR